MIGEYDIGFRGKFSPWILITLRYKMREDENYGIQITSSDEPEEQGKTLIVHGSDLNEVLKELEKRNCRGALNGPIENKCLEAVI